MQSDFFEKLTARQKNLLIVGMFGVLVLLLYGNTLFHGFVYDDLLIVRDNDYIQQLRYLPKVITGCTWEDAFGQC